MYIIPEGFIGEVEIEFTDTGNKREYKDGWRVYRIDAHGKCTTKFSLQYCWLKVEEKKYYYAGPGGQLTEICSDTVRMKERQCRFYISDHQTMNIKEEGKLRNIYLFKVQAVQPF